MMSWEAAEEGGVAVVVVEVEVAVALTMVSVVYFDLLLRVEMGYCSSVRFRLEQTSVVRVDCSVSEYKKLSAY